MNNQRSIADTLLSPEPIMPGEIVPFQIDYTLDFAEVVPVDTIATSTWATSDAAVATIAAESNTTNVSLVKVSAVGRLGQIVRLTNTVVTTNGYTYKRLLVLKISNKPAQRTDDDVVFAVVSP